MPSDFDDFRNRKKKLLKQQEEKKAAQEKKEEAKKKSTIFNPVIIPQVIKQEVIIQKEPIDSVRLLPNGKKLPPPFDPNEFRNLVSVIKNSSDSSEKKGRVYGVILESALATTKSLLELYNLIPQIWSGSSTAMSDFKKILDQSSKSVGIRPEHFVTKQNISFQKLKSRADSLSGSGGFSPCGPLFFIKPDVIHSIQETIYFMSDGNRTFSQIAMAIVSQLWKNTRVVDTLNVLANNGKGDVFPELFGYLDRIAETYRLENNLGRIEEQRIRLNKGNLGPMQLPFEGTWFPPEPGFPFPPLGPDDGPGWPGFPVDCQPIRDFCQDVLTGPSTVYRGEIPVSVSSSEIRRISATSICNKKDLIIEGVGFGNVQGNRGVVFGTTEGTIKSWSDRKIVVESPSSVQGTVCIGIIDRDKEKRRREIHKINQKSFGELINAAGPCLRLPGRISDLPYMQDSPVCTGINQIKVGKPIIRLFNINNAENPTVITGSDLLMKWSVENADSIRFTVSTTSTVSPPKNFPTGNPSSGTQPLGTLIDKKAVIHFYKIEAENACGISEATIEVFVSSPKINILGIEAVQAIQKFDWDNPNENNSVFLVSNKLTMVRVYPESEKFFDFDFEPNRLINIEAKLKVKYPDGQFSSYSISHAPPAIFKVGPKNNLSRENLDKSFNFILPSYKLDGLIELTAEIIITPQRGAVSYSKSSTSVTFKKTKKLKLALILVKDTINGLPAPSRQDFNEAFHLGKGRLPIGDSDFKIYLPPNHLEIKTETITYLIPYIGLQTYSEDLKTKKGWSNLLDRLDDIADDYANSDEVIWVGLVPLDTNGIYSWGGLANSGVNKAWFDDHRRLLSQSGRPKTLIHELAHTLKIKHAASVNTATNLNVHSCMNPDGVDSTMISTIEDIGIDVLRYKDNINSPHVLPKGVPSLMTYCSPSINGAQVSSEYSWVSIDLWNRLRNNL